MSEIPKQTLPYGTWPSTLSASMVTASSASLGMPYEYQSMVLATESRPSEGGRIALVQRSDSFADAEILPKKFSVRTRVHEYGGRAWWLGRACLYFCEWSDQRLYAAYGAVTDLNDPVPITPEPLTEHGLRFADGVETPDGAWVITVAEIHGEDRTRFDVPRFSEYEPANVLVAIPSDGSAAEDVTAIKVLAMGSDFVSNPRISPDGKHLSWLQWHHPNMPWDTTELMVADVVYQSDSLIELGNPNCVVGADGVSVVGPQWTHDSKLVYSTDESGWWNLHALNTASQHIEVLTRFDDAEIGAPAWAVGTTRFAELVSETALAGSAPWLVLAITENASDWLGVLSRDGAVTRLPLNCAAIRGISATEDGGLLVLAELHEAKSEQYHFSADDIRQVRSGSVLRTDHNDAAKTFHGSIAEAIQFPTAAGEIAHAFYYAPLSNSFEGPADQLPPLIVMGHGGPTSHSTPALRMAIQFWTTRGFAVADVNYRGSSGFGRRYRQGLNEAWGVVDVEDCIHVVEYLTRTDRVDAQRCVIRGGSAGGLTVLRALQLSTVFAAGTSLYGVADLEALLMDTHKFESRYLDNLIGSYPEHQSRYKERSPINYADQINVPLLVLQGDEDKVVPPAQSEAIVAAVAAQGLAHAYIVFEGEQHGWRQESTLIRALELELWFYGAALGFSPADKLSAPAEAVGF